MKIIINKHWFTVDQVTTKPRLQGREEGQEEGKGRGGEGEEKEEVRQNKIIKDKRGKVWEHITCPGREVLGQVWGQ